MFTESKNEERKKEETKGKVKTSEVRKDSI